MNTIVKLDDHTEIPHEKGMGCVRCPFSVNDVVVVINIQAEYLSPLHKNGLVSCQEPPGAFSKLVTDSAELLQATLGVIDVLIPLLCLSVASSEGVLERGKPWIELNDALSSCQSRHDIVRGKTYRSHPRERRPVQLCRRSLPIH